MPAPSDGCTQPRGTDDLVLHPSSVSCLRGPCGAWLRGLLSPCVAPSLQVWGPWSAGPRPGHPGSCTHKRGDGGSGWEAVCPALRPPAPGTQLSGLCLGGLDLGHLASLYPGAVGGDRRATNRLELGLAQSGYSAAVAGRLGRARCVTGVTACRGAAGMAGAPTGASSARAPWRASPWSAGLCRGVRSGRGRSEGTRLNSSHRIASRMPSSA